MVRRSIAAVVALAAATAVLPPLAGLISAAIATALGWLFGICLLIVPLVSAFFLDLVNAFLIPGFIGQL